MQHVYVIGPKSGPQKIGIARDTEKRRGDLQIGYPHRLVVAFATPHEDARAVELFAHSILAERRLNGEWFDVEPEAAIAAIRDAVSRVDAGEELPERAVVAPEPMSAETFRQTLRDVGLRQRQLAAELGLAAQTVNRWAVGEIPVPHYAIAYVDLWRRVRDIVAE